MVTNIFWGVVALDVLTMIAATVLMSRQSSGPEGPVGAWLLFIPPLFVAGVVAAVLLTKSNTARIVGICLLGFPWILAVVGPLNTLFSNYVVERDLSGDAYFSGVFREMAHAIRARDVTKVKSLIPKAGDLNPKNGEETILLFALNNAADPKGLDLPPPPGSLEIVQALLDAHADPNLAHGTYRPLDASMSRSPDLTLMLLKAGANPNTLDTYKQPLWWGILSNDNDRGIETLQHLLDHGADVKLRNGESGPVGYAAYYAKGSYHSSWRATWMLIEHGAAWKGEQQFGQSVEQMIFADIEQRKQQGPLPDALEKLKARYSIP